MITRFRLKTVQVELTVEHEASALPDGRVESAEDAAAILPAIMAKLKARPDRECFVALGLDARGRPCAMSLVAVGTLTSCLVHPREVYVDMIRGGAAQVVVAHNHPSGDPTPSAEDIELTARLAVAGALVGTPLLDHIIVTAEGRWRSVTPPNANVDAILGTLKAAE